MTPGSSKMSPERPTIIDRTHFGDPPGSKMTPRGPIVTPGVPKVIPRVSQSDPQGAKCEPRGAQSDHPGPPKPQKGSSWVPKAIPRPLSKLLFAFLRHPVFAIMFPANPWPHQPTNPSTLQPNNPSTPIPFNTGPAECAERSNNVH